jgi:predicted porin
MKKSLVALAVLAAAGVASAQSSVTLSGAYAFGFKSTKSAAGVKASGFGTDTAAMKLTAVEDLGGGLKASAHVGLGGMMRDGAGTGEDAGLSLAGGFGTLSLRTFESGHGLTPLAFAGVPGIGLDGKVLGANANIDLLGYTSANFGGFTFGVNYVDRGATVGSGLGEGTTGPASAQPSVGLSVSYANGPIAARADYTSWTRKGDAAVASNTNDNRVRLSGNYNLGVARVGLGYSQLARTTNVDTKEVVFGVSAPIGPVQAGLGYASQDTDGAAKKTGFTVGADYAISKRTTLGTSFASWKAAGANAATEFRVLMGHSF